MAQRAQSEKASAESKSTGDRRGRSGREAGVGNRSTGALLRLGSPADDAERRADGAADAVMRRIAGLGAAAPAIGPRAAAGIVRREGGGGAGGISAGQSGRIRRAMTGGRPISGPARGELERGFGRSLGKMRVHDGPDARSLSRAFGARAFSVDNHLFFGEGAYRPETKVGKRLLSHEIAHGLEGEAGVVRRLTYDSTLNKYYSDALKGQAVDATHGVATVTGSASVWHGGHAFIYLEYLDRDPTSGGAVPRTRKLELTAGGGTTSGTRSGSGSGWKSGHKMAHGSGGSQGKSSGSSGSDSGSATGLAIHIGDAEAGDISALRRARRRKSWVVGRTAMDGILAKAEDIKTNIKSYTYKLTGRSLFATKKTINCVRFAEKILKAGGIAASAGKAMKLASTLTSGDDVGYEQDQDWVQLEETRAVQREQRRQQEALAARQAALAAKTQTERLKALGIDEDRKYSVVWDPSVATIRGKSLNSGGTMVPYTLVDRKATAPGELERAPYVAFAEVLTSSNQARVYGSVIFSDGDRRNQIEVHLGDVLAAITSAT